MKNLLIAALFTLFATTAFANEETIDDSYDFDEIGDEASLLKIHLNKVPAPSKRDAEGTITTFTKIVGCFSHQEGLSGDILGEDDKKIAYTIPAGVRFKLQLLTITSHQRTAETLPIYSAVVGLNHIKALGADITVNIKNLAINGLVVEKACH